MAIAARAAASFMLPLALVACGCHIYIHAIAARRSNPSPRLIAASNLLMLVALILQFDFNAGANCARDALEGVAWRLGWANELACTWYAGFPSIAVNLLLYVPVGVTWLSLRSSGRSSG